MITKIKLCWTVVLVIGCLICLVRTEANSEDATVSNSPDSPPGELPLYLTPYIKKGQYDVAKNRSIVSLFWAKANVTAYSGFITVNETYNSNLFFLFLVSEGNKSEAPVVLWTQGGPGLSALFGEFLQNGPIAYDLAKNFTIRTNTLQKIANVLYLDLPLGAGYSFTNHSEGYSKSLKEITDDAINFLEQFFKLFSEYKSRNFYAAGESYAARYSVSIANRLLTSKNDNLPSLKGVIGGNGFLGPILDISDSTEFMFQMSMLDESGRLNFSNQFQIMRMMALNQTLAPSVPLLLSQTIFTSTPPSLLQNLTLYDDYMSPLITQRPLYVIACFMFLNTTTVRDALHIGPDIPFQYDNMNLLYSLAPDYLTNISDIVANVLENTSLLLYSGQLDKLFPAVNQRNYLLSLQWKDAQTYNNSQRCPWRPRTWSDHQGFAGFLRQTDKFTDAVLLGMSHYGSAEKPDEMFYLMEEFITNSSGVENKILP